MKSTSICVAKILSAHGVRGEVKLQCYMEDLDLFTNIDQFHTKDQRRTYQLNSLRGQKKNVFIATFEEIDDRNEAEQHRNTELFIDRAILPDIDEEDEFYIEDLKGLEVFTENHTIHYGKVKAVHNFGAGDVIEITEHASGQSLYYPFTKAVIPTINLDENYIELIIPETLIDEESQQKQ